MYQYTQLLFHIYQFGYGYPSFPFSLTAYWCGFWEMKCGHSIPRQSFFIFILGQGLNLLWASRKSFSFQQFEFNTFPSLFPMGIQLWWVTFLWMFLWFFCFSWLLTVWLWCVVLLIWVYFICNLLSNCFSSHLVELSF